MEGNLIPIKQGKLSINGAASEQLNPTPVIPNKSSARVRKKDWVCGCFNRHDGLFYYQDGNGKCTTEKCPDIRIRPSPKPID